MKSVYDITDHFEQLLCQYTGSPYAVAIDNASNALFLALIREGIEGKTITIPKHTYPSVPCEIIHAGGKVEFTSQFGCIDKEGYLTGAYVLEGSKVIDSALHFDHNMFNKSWTYILSFTGPHKHLKLGKGGAILTASYEDYLWYKRARFSGRRECSYLEDNLDMLGWNFYMLPEIAAKGVRDITAFLPDVVTEPKRIRYPDLSKFQIYKK